MTEWTNDDIAWMDSFAVWLKVKRAQLDLSQTELAAAIGVKRNTVSGWETASRMIYGPSFHRLQRFFKAQFPHPRRVGAMKAQPRRRRVP